MTGGWKPWQFFKKFPGRSTKPRHFVFLSHQLVEAIMRTELVDISIYMMYLGRVSMAFVKGRHLL